MSIRTDLALEARQNIEEKGQQPDDGIVCREDKAGDDVTVTSVEITTKAAQEQLGKPMGTYITIENLHTDRRDMDTYMNLSRVLAGEIKKLMKDISPGETVLIAGLGNRSMTPDALGPKTVDKILVTRHLHQYLPRQVDERLRPVCAVAPGVLGVTGIETADMIISLCKKIKPSMVILIDALAARKSERIFSTIQLADSGIAPGAGVGNKRSAISKEVLGVPVVVIGIPMVVYASTLVVDALESCLPPEQSKTQPKELAQQTEAAGEKLGEMVVTPKEIDILIEDSARILADGLNMALHHNISLEEVRAYMF